MISPSLEQQAFRFRNDDGTQTTATWVAAQNTNATLEVDTNYRLRFQIQENNGAAETRAFQLQYNLNGAGFVNVGALSSVVRSSASPNFADGDNTTSQITGGSGTFVAGQMDENDGIGSQTAIGAGGRTEWEYCFQILSADVADNDTIQLRVIRNTGAALDTYTVTPQATVNVAGAASDDVLIRFGSLTATTGSGLVTTLFTATTPPTVVSGGSYYHRRRLNDWTTNLEDL